MKSSPTVVVQLFALLGAFLLTCMLLSCSSTASPEQQEPEQAFRIVSVETRVTEENETWRKYAWNLTLENLSNRNLWLIATLQWLDADGFVIDEDIEYDLYLASSETKTFRGYELISMPAASNVDSIHASASETSPGEQEPEQAFRIVSVETRVTEENETWRKYAWNLTLENLSNRNLWLIATLQWLDADGFVIDEDIEYDLYLASSETKTFRSYELIRMPAALNVDSIHASVKERDY